MNATPRERLPLFPLGTVLFPGLPLPLRIFEPRYVDMVGECMREGRGFGVVLITRGREAGEPAETVAIGTLARIVDFQSLPDGLLGITALGERRFRVLHRERRANGLMVGEVEYLPADPAVKVPAARTGLAGLLRGALRELGAPFSTLDPDFDDAAAVGQILSGLLPVAPALRQQLLELDDPLERLDVLHGLIRQDPA